MPQEHTTSAAASGTPSRHAQTLSRGLRALEILAASERPLTIAALAQALDVHRSIAYRILRTLEDHGLVLRDTSGRVQPGPGLAVLARGVYRDLQEASQAELTAIAADLGMTAFLVVLDHGDCVTLASVESRATAATVAQRPGTRHPLDIGAPGIAIQSRLTPHQWEELGSAHTRRGEVDDAVRNGYATSHDEVIPGLHSVAAPLILPGRAPAALGAVYVATGFTEAEIGARLQRGVEEVTAFMS